MSRMIALIFGLWLLWVLLVERFAGWDLGLGMLTGVLCAGLSLRFSRASLAIAPIAAVKVAKAFVERCGAVWRGAGLTMRAAWSADVTVHPALARVRLRSAQAAPRAIYAMLAGAAPGAVAMELDVDGALLHLLHEERVDAHAFGRLEAAVAQALGRTETMP